MATGTTSIRESPQPPEEQGPQDRAAACTLAGAKTFREIGDQAADLPQKVLRGLGGKPHYLPL